METKVDETIKAVLAAVEGKLLDSGWQAEARDPSLRQKLDAVLRTFLLRPSGPGRPTTPPDLSNVDDELNNIATLLRAQQSAAASEDPVFSVFLGSGAHFGPPDYATRSVADAYPASSRPPVGSALAQLLAKQSNFATAFPDENPNDWMRVAAWHERKNNRGGVLGLETQITAAVETGKRASEMVRTIASWPCRNFYTTNFDTHLEQALIEKGRKEIFVWVYTPKATDLRQCWWQMTGTNKFEKWEPAWNQAPVSGVPSQPPTESTVIFKLHGDVRVQGSLVITEDDYIKFLRRVARQHLPTRLLNPLGKSVVFIGYSLRDFNMRYILSLLREERDTNWENQQISYSVDLRPDPLVKAIWQDRDNLINFIAHNLWDVIPAVHMRFETHLDG